MPGKTCFHSGVSLGVAHLSDYNNIGIKSERSHYQILLSNIISRIIRGAGERMHHIVYYLAILYFYKRQLAGA